MDNYERKRITYKPKPIKILFIGESRPASGKFFYDCNSNLFRATETGFNSFFHKSFKNQDFLEYFMKMGCYLEDLCETPVNNLPPIQRIEERIKYMPILQLKLKDHQPEIAVIIMKEIADCVVKVIKDSKINSIKHLEIISFPIGDKNKLDFHSGIIRILKKASQENIINNAT